MRLAWASGVSGGQRWPARGGWWWRRAVATLHRGARWRYRVPETCRDGKGRISRGKTARSGRDHGAAAERRHAGPTTPSRRFSGGAVNFLWGAASRRWAATGDGKLRAAPSHVEDLSVLSPHESRLNQLRAVGGEQERRATPGDGRRQEGRGGGQEGICERHRAKPPTIHVSSQVRTKEIHRLCLIN